MDIRADEIDTIKVIGNLNEDQVKLIRMKGGFFLAVGKANKKDKESKPLAAGSHQGIVLHQIEKEFKKDFEPTMAKSELEDIGNLRSLTAFIPKEFSSKGYDMFSLEKNGEIEYVVTKYNFDVASVSLFKNSEEFSSVSIKDPKMKQDFSKWIATAMKNG